MQYRERLYPSPSSAVALLLLPPAVMVVTAPINIVIGLIVGPVLYIAIVLIAYFASPLIEITDGTFRAGRAQIPTGLLGEAIALSSAQQKHALREDLDARAYLCIRGGKVQMVRVPVTDPADSTPYWLVSSRNASKLARALNASHQQVSSGPQDIPTAKAPTA